MQATSAQNLPNQRLAATAFLAAIFAAGAAFGTFAGIAIAPRASSVGVTQAASDVYAGPRLGRGGVTGPIVIKGIGGDVTGLRLQRTGEIRLGLATTVVLPNRAQREEEMNGGVAAPTTSTSSKARYEVSRGK